MTATTIDRRRVLLGSALLGATALAVAARPPRLRTRVTQAELEAMMPRDVPGFRQAETAGVVLPPEDALSALIYDGLVVRSYVAADGAPLSLVVAYGTTQDYALQIHRPESCYPASGFRIGPVSPASVPLGDRTIPASTLLATRGRRHERLLYWTRVGDRFPVSLWQEREAIVAAALRHRTADGVLVRLSTSVEEGGEALLLGFAKAWAAALPEAGRVLLTGATRA